MRHDSVVGLVGDSEAITSAKEGAAAAAQQGSESSQFCAGVRSFARRLTTSAAQPSAFQTLKDAPEPLSMAEWNESRPAT
jgi:hypothetical protein